MNILLINHYAGTPALGMEYRPYYLAREWVRAGHRVQVLAANFSHVRSQQPAAGDEVIDGIHYAWLPTPAYRGNGWGRLKNILSFLSQVAALTPRLVAEFKPDIVISSSTYPMDHWVARRIARAAGARLVHEVHDLWPLSLVELAGLSSWHPLVLVCGSAERAAYRHSDVVVSMLPKVHQHMARRGLDLQKLAIVPNGISPEEWPDVRPDARSDVRPDVRPDARRRDVKPEPLRADVEQAIDAARRSGAVIVAYAGSMGAPNALDTLLDAAARLRDKQIHIVLVGDGHEREHLARRIADEALLKVTLLPPIPKAQIPGFLRAIDIAYIGWQPMPIYRFGIAPNKLMDYMMAARPVVHSVAAGNDPVADAGCGLTVAPGSPDEVARALTLLAALSPQQRRVFGDKGRAFVLAHHAYPVLAKCFLDAVRVRR